MRKCLTLFLIGLLISCATADQVIKRGLSNAALAVKIADERLAETMPIISEKIIQDIRGTCGDQETCKQIWREKMSNVERAITSLETAKKILLDFEKLYYSMAEGKEKHSLATLLSKASAVVRSLDSATDLLKQAGVESQEVDDAIKIMKDIIKNLKGGAS